MASRSEPSRIKSRIILDAIGDQVLVRLRLAAGREDLGLDADLEDTLPADGVVEGLVSDLEDDFGVELTDTQLLASMAGTASDLAKCLTRQSLARLQEKSAFSNPHQQRQSSHQRYLSNRQVILGKAKAYRMAHLQVIRRKAKAYHKKVKRGQIRPKKRVGTAASGYTFVPR